jgi:hypothetical protein
VIIIKNEYLKEDKISEKTDEEKERELIVSIIRLKKELDEVNKNFEYAEGDLIDYYTYQIKANRSKFDYLVKQAKNNGIQLDMIKQIEINYSGVI